MSQIRALYDFEAGTSEELTFREGDILYIVKDENPDWYEAEMSGMRGMVPKNYFEIYSGDSNYNYSGNDSYDYNNDYGNGYDDQYQSQDYAPTVYPDFEAAQSKKALVLVAKVLYDYQAQHADEISAEVGDLLQIINDEDPDWFYAKPITKLGDSGLFPKTYCEIEDLSTQSKGKDEEKRKKDEEEKRIKEEQKRKEKEEKERKKEEEKIEKEKERIEREKKKEEERQEKEKKKEEERIEKEKKKEEERKRKEEERKRKEEEERIRLERIAAEKAAFRAEYGALVHDDITQVRVSEWEKKIDKQYYFHVEVYRGSGNRMLYRTYQEFYDFHMKLLDCFPEESGEGGHQRVIPYLPGQKLLVNDAVTKQRRIELDEYCVNLFKLQDKVKKSRIVVEFFLNKSGDEMSIPQRTTPISRAISVIEPSANADPSEFLPPPPNRSAPRPPQSRPPPLQGGPVRPSGPPPGGAPGGGPMRPSGPPPGGQQGGPMRPSGPPPGGAPMRPSGPPPGGAPGGAPKGQRGPPPAISDRPGFLQNGPPPQQNTPPQQNNPPPQAVQYSTPFSSDMIKVKVYYKEDIICFMIKPNTPCTQIKEKAFKKLKISGKILQYKDEDNELVTLAGDDDLIMALEAHPGVLRLWVA